MFRKSNILCQLVGLCKKQTSVSHSSTEVEVTSLYAGSRMDGIPALDLWDLMVEVHSMKHAKTNSNHAH